MSEILTYVACLTPLGQGAIASLGICGSNAWQAVSSLFRTKSGKALPPEPIQGRFWFGHSGTEIADEVILGVERIEPLPCLTIHCHGGREVVTMLLEAFRNQGCSVCDWREFLSHTELDPIRRLATEALTRAPTGRTAAILLDQYNGAFTVAIKEIRKYIEAGNHAAAPTLFADLVRWTSLGRHLTTPWRVTIAGPPNVGKSSLVNALAGYQRCVIAPTPGTTRDVVTVLTAVEGWPIELADTAGLRAAGEFLEAQGIEQARGAAEQADLCLWLLDASADPIWPEKRTEKMRFVVNKIDQPPAWDLARAPDAVPISARTGEGMGALCASIASWLVPEAPGAGVAVPFTAELCERTEAVLDELSFGRIEETNAALQRLEACAGIVNSQEAKLSVQSR